MQISTHKLVCVLGCTFSFCKIRIRENEKVTLVKLLVLLWIMERTVQVVERCARILQKNCLWSLERRHFSTVTVFDYCQGLRFLNHRMNVLGDSEEMEDQIGS